MTPLECNHKDKIVQDIQAKDESICEDCVLTNDSWVALRMCLSCGHVGCCDSSKNKHATKHYHDTDHPIMKSVTAGQEFMWCYADAIYLQ